MVGFSPGIRSRSVKLSSLAKNLVSGTQQKDSYFGGIGRLSGRSTKRYSEYIAFKWPGVLPLFVILTFQFVEALLSRTTLVTNQGRSDAMRALAFSSAASA